MSIDIWTSPEIPLDKPNPARIYDYLLGGYHNFEPDRKVADQVTEVFPDVRANAVAHRAFLRRAVKYLTDQGIDQFLDIGSGIPTIGNVHEVAQAADPASRIVYVDIDPVVIVHSKLMLQDNPNVTIVQADLSRPEEILNHTVVRDLLDLSQPLAVCVTAVLHYLSDDERAYNAVRALRDGVVSGSYLLISQVSYDDASEETIAQAVNVYRPAADIKVRSYEEIERFFDGLELVEPGLVRAPLWRPEASDDVLLDSPKRYLGFGGLGRKV